MKTRRSCSVSLVRSNMRMEIVGKFRAHFNSSEEILLFIRIFLFITVLPLLIRFLTLPQLMKVLTWRVSRFSQNRNDEDYKERIVRFTDYILTRNFWIYKNTCLKRSLVLFHLLHRVVSDIHICFGVRLKKDVAARDGQKELEGHAWLTYNGELFLERNPDIRRTYMVTYCFPERLTSARDH